MGVCCSKSFKKESKEKTHNSSSKNHYDSLQTIHNLEEQSTENSLQNKKIIPSCNNDSNTNDHNNQSQCNPVIQELHLTSQLLSSDNSLKNERAQCGLFIGTLPAQVQEHIQQHDKDIVTETFKNIPKNLQNSREYITELQSRLMCDLCDCHMTSGSMIYHLQGRKRLWHLFMALWHLWWFFRTL